MIMKDRLPDGLIDPELTEGLIVFWNEFSVLENPGGTTWDVLEELQRRVTDCLARGTPQDLLLAHRLTAQAICLLGE